MNQEKTKTQKGIVRKIDSLGRIVIPSEFRKELNVTEGSKIEFSLYESDEKKHIEIRKADNQ